jgi:transcriptional regulator with XRE-family HTH domain
MFILVMVCILNSTFLKNIFVDMEKNIHQGKNIARLRQMLGMKQDALASILGDDWNQMKVSRLEAKEEIDSTTLNEVAKALKMPVEAIKNFDEEAAINNIACNFNDHASVNYKPTFNPFDKFVEAVEKIERLYEALLQSEREKVALLERILQDKK